MDRRGFASICRLTLIGLVLGVGAHGARLQASSVDPASPSAPSETLPPAFGLVLLKDNINALSPGTDPVPSAAFIFSVDRVAVAPPGSPVNGQAAPGVEQAQSDLYKYVPPTNLVLDAGFPFFEDDTDAIGGGPYFSMDRTSITNLSASGVYSDDILVAGGGGFVVWADGVATMGLQPGDDLDALMLDNVLTPGLDPGFDMALFSIDPFSPSATTMGGSISPADVLFTDFTGSFSVFVSAGALELLADDNLDALSHCVLPDWHATRADVPTDTVVDFGAGGIVIPGGFFGVGSDPFAAPVPMQGEPIDPRLGDSSVCMQRNRDPSLPTFGSVDTVEIAVVGLNLRSTSPMTVTYNGGQNPELWNVAVALSPSSIPPRGSLTATRTHANGGTFSSQFSIQPALTFTRVPDGQVMVLDTGDTENPVPLNFSISGDFVDTVDPNLGILVDPAANWVSGVFEDAGGQQIVPLTATTDDIPPTVVHTVTPPREPAVPGRPCTVPDNGTGTVELPPEGCEYLSPFEVHMIIDGLPPDTEILMDPIHAGFTNRVITPGGVLGGEVEDFDSTLHMTLTGTGQLEGYHRNLDIPIQCQTHTGPRNPGDDIQDFDTEMFFLQGAIFGDQDFAELFVIAGQGFDPALASPGHTTLTRLGGGGITEGGGGEFLVESFFDVTYEITFIGTPGGALAGLSGATVGTVGMEAQRSGSACDAGVGDCFAANGSPACEDPDCCALVCDVDPFCCDSEWDPACAAVAADLCVTEAVPSVTEGGLLVLLTAYLAATVILIRRRIPVTSGLR